MNIYEKINAVRMALLKRDIGKDKKAFNYSYIDLPQIENAIIEECDKVKLLTIVTFPVNDKGSFAEMTAYDMDSDMSGIDTRTHYAPPSSVTISVPCDYSLVEIKGSQPIQKVGGMMTYMRRYLYMTLFAISEHDSVEGIGKLSQETANDLDNIGDDGKKEIDKERKGILERIEKDLPKGYLKQVIAYKKADSIDDIPTDYLIKVYNKKMGVKEQKDEGNA